MSEEDAGTPKRRLRNLSTRKIVTLPPPEPSPSPLISVSAAQVHVTAERCGVCGAGQDCGLGQAECGHHICKECVTSTVSRAMDERRCTNLFCPMEACEGEMATSFLQDSLAAETFQAYLEACFAEYVEQEAGDQEGVSLVTCPQSDPVCGCTMEWLQPTEQENLTHETDAITKTGEDGRLLSRGAWQHFNANRLRCPRCTVDFCAACATAPYHLGLTCQQLEQLGTEKHCRFCEVRIVVGENLAPCSSYAALMDCCTEDECLEKRERACERTLECGHHCGGVRGEEECLPCMEEDCQKLAESSDQEKGDFCNICWISDLGSEPSIQLGCRHIVHAQCALRVLEHKWNTSYVSFKFWNCPLCQVPMRHPSLTQALKPLQELQENIVRLGTQVIGEEGLGADKALVTDLTSRYHANTPKLVLEKLTFFMCGKCDEPFYGGRLDCMQRNSLEAGEEQERVCEACATNELVTCGKAEHHAFWVFKCRFCCSRAKFFCFGDTHFCEDCHSRVAEIRLRKEHPQCIGPLACPLGVAHPPNGEEFVVGCEMCQEEHQRSPEATARIRAFEKQQRQKEERQRQTVATVKRLAVPLLLLLVLSNMCNWQFVLSACWLAAHVVKYAPTLLLAIACIYGMATKRYSLFQVALSMSCVASGIAMEMACKLPYLDAWELLPLLSFFDIVLRVVSYFARIIALIFPPCACLLMLLEQRLGHAGYMAGFGAAINIVSFLFGTIAPGYASFGAIVDASVTVARLTYVCLIILGYVSYSMFKCSLGCVHARWRFVELMASFAICWAMIMELIIYNVGHFDHVFALDYWAIFLRLVLLSRFCAWGSFAFLLLLPPKEALTSFRLHLLVLGVLASLEVACWATGLTWSGLVAQFLVIFRCSLSC